MNIRLVKVTLGRILMLEAFFMVLPLAVAIYFGEDFQNIMSFLLVIATLLILGSIAKRENIEGLSFWS